MKNVVKGAIIVGAMLAAGSAAADMMGDIKPFVGVDYYQAWMEGKGNFAVGAVSANRKDLYPKSYPGAAVYVGIRFMENFAVELGGLMSSNKKASATVANRAYTTKIRRQGFYADLVGSLPLNECFSLIGSLGLEWAKPKISESYTIGAASTAVTTSTKYKTLGRVGAGVSYMVTEMFGLRLKANWEQTTALRVNYNNAGSVKAFDDTISVTAGVFAQF